MYQVFRLTYLNISYIIGDIKTIFNFVYSSNEMTTVTYCVRVAPTGGVWHGDEEA